MKNVDIFEQKFGFLLLTKNAWPLNQRRHENFLFYKIHFFKKFIFVNKYSIKSNVNIYFNFSQNTNFFVSSLDFEFCLSQCFANRWRQSKSVLLSSRQNKQMANFEVSDPRSSRVFFPAKSPHPGTYYPAHQCARHIGFGPRQARIPSNEEEGRFLFLCALSFLALLLNLTSKLRHANSRKNHVSVRQKLTDLEFRWYGIE